MINKLIHELEKFKTIWRLRKIVPEWVNAIVALDKYVGSPHNLVIMVDRYIMYNKESAGFLEPLVTQVNEYPSVNSIWVLIPVPVLTNK